MRTFHGCTICVRLKRASMVGGVGCLKWAICIAISAILSASLALAGGESLRLATETGTLHATLDIPDMKRPFPVVLIIAGSGPTDRDGNQPLMRNDSLKLLGQALAGRGIASLRYDKRGVGASVSAAPAEKDLRFETFVDDARGWIELLRRDGRFTRVAVIGHSEGSLIGMLAARQAKAHAFVSIAGPGRGAAELIRDQLRGLPVELKTRSDRILSELVANRYVADVPHDLQALFRPSVQPYLISWFKYDPAREIAPLEAPVLIVQGTTDLQVSVDDAKRLAGANRGAKLALVDGMNHVLRRATTPAEQRAAYVESSWPIEVKAVDAIAEFVGMKTSDGR